MAMTEAQDIERDWAEHTRDLLLKHEGFKNKLLARLSLAAFPCSATGPDAVLMSDVRKIIDELGKDL